MPEYDITALKDILARVRIPDPDVQTARERTRVQCKRERFIEEVLSNFNDITITDLYNEIMLHSGVTEMERIEFEESYAVFGKRNKYTIHGSSYKILTALRNSQEVRKLLEL